MDAERFDALTRLIGSRTSRRMAVGLAATGLLTIVVPGTEAVGCSKTTPCPECQRCKKHKCKPKKALSQCTEGGTCCSPDLCCPQGQTCSDASPSCEACPVTDICTDGFTVCGYSGAKKKDWCGCITSVEGTTTCSSLFGACFACTTDQECTDEFGDEFGGEMICADATGCACGATGGKVCIIRDCVDPAATAAVQSEGVGGLKRLAGVRPAP